MLTHERQPVKSPPWGKRKQTQARWGGRANLSSCPYRFIFGRAVITHEGPWGSAVLQEDGRGFLCGCFWVYFSFVLNLFCFSCWMVFMGNKVEEFPKPISTLCLPYLQLFFSAFDVSNHHSTDHWTAVYLDVWLPIVLARLYLVFLLNFNRK